MHAEAFGYERLKAVWAGTKANCILEQVEDYRVALRQHIPRGLQRSGGFGGAGTASHDGHRVAFL
jgi:hypothetical protein